MFKSSRGANVHHDDVTTAVSFVVLSNCAQAQGGNEMRNAITTAELFDVVANTSENAAQAGKDDVRMDSLPAARLYTAIPRRI